MKKKGFTIIETTLVLAIAGLIFLLAFVALPALSRSQRDSERKDDVMLLADNIKKWQSNNNRGALPEASDLNTIKQKFLNNNFEDPDGQAYKFAFYDGAKDSKNINTANAAVTDKTELDYTMHFVTGAKCKDGNLAESTSNTRKAVILYILENGHAPYCFEL